MGLFYTTILRPPPVSDFPKRGDALSDFAHALLYPVTIILQYFRHSDLSEPILNEPMLSLQKALITDLDRLACFRRDREIGSNSELGSPTAIHRNAAR